MKGVVLLALAVTLVMVAGNTPSVRRNKPYKRRHKPNKQATSYPDIEHLSTLVDGLEEDLGKIAEDLTEAATLCAITDAQLDQISGFFIPKSNLIVQQQSEIITDFNAQRRAQRKEVDLVMGDNSAAMSLAESTKAELQSQISNCINGSQLGDMSNTQNQQIAQLSADLSQEKTTFLARLDNLTIDLTALHDLTGSKIQRLDRFVASRRCETGYISIGASQSRAVYFQTPFRQAPNVSLSLTGFQADLNAYYQAKADGLTLKKEVIEVYPSYFVLRVKDLSKGMVRGRYTGCRWVACQNIQGTFLNLHDDQQNMGSHGRGDDGEAGGGMGSDNLGGDDEAGDGMGGDN